MENPFDVITRRLTAIEELVVDLNRKGSPSPTNTYAEPDELLTPDETAKLLKVSKVTVWDWTANRGILTKYTIGNQVRYLKSEVLAAVIKRSLATNQPHQNAA